MRKWVVAAAVGACVWGGGGCGGSVVETPSARPELSALEREAEHLSGVIQLTSGREFERAGEAYFSPDMRWVVFQAVPKPKEGETPETGYQMYVGKLVWVRGEPAGLVGITRVSPRGSRNTCGYFAPDGRTLIFASTAGKDDPEEAAPGYQREGSRYRWAFSRGMEIYVARDWERLVMAGAPDAIVDLTAAGRRVTDNDAYDAECSVSPGKGEDGEWIVFCSDRPGVVFERATTRATDGGESNQNGARPKQLWAMRLDGTGLVQLTDTQGYNGGAFFSPDGKKLVYRSDRVGNDLLQVMTAEVVYAGGGWGEGRKRIVGLRNERKVTDDGNVNWGPYWTPDGAWILYSTSKVGHTNYEIFARRADGSEETRVTYGAGPDVLPVVSPDGRYLMWSSRRGGDAGAQIYLAGLRLPGKR